MLTQAISAQRCKEGHGDLCLVLCGLWVSCQVLPLWGPMLKSAWCELTTNWVWPMRDKLSNGRNTIRKLWLHRCMLGNTGPEYFSPFLSLLRPARAAWAMFGQCSFPSCRTYLGLPGAKLWQHCLCRSLLHPPLTVSLTLDAPHPYSLLCSRPFF